MCTIPSTALIIEIISFTILILAGERLTKKMQDNKTLIRSIIINVLIQGDTLKLFLASRTSQLRNVSFSTELLSMTVVLNLRAALFNSPCTFYNDPLQYTINETTFKT